MISRETARGRIRVARVSAELSPSTRKLVDEAIARGIAGAEEIRRNAARRNRGVAW